MTYDVIVVGGGAAGSLVAGRLAAETDASVLLLEADGQDWNHLIHMPAGFSKLLHHEMFLYLYATVPQMQLDGRPRSLEQGKGLGGGTSINSMCYVRGQRADYDRWDKVLDGVGGWSYADLLPHFCAMEGNDIFAGPYHGETGPLKVIQPPEINALNQAVIRAFQSAGLPYNADYNGAEERGVSPCQMMIGDAKRCSAATAFLNPARGRKNLTALTGAPATRLVLEGDRVTGVSYLHHGKTVLVSAGEVVVCAGALNAPRLLMLSGIGPEGELARHGIQVRVDSPHVGRNLQDHPQVPLSVRARIDIGYAGTPTDFVRWRSALSII